MKVEDIKEGKVYRIDISRSPENSPCGKFDSFELYDGHEVSCINILEETPEAFFYNGWYFSKEVLVEVKGKKAKRIIKKDSRKYTDFKEGDLVKIRTIEDLKEHFYSDNNYIYTKPDKIELGGTDYTRVIGKEAIIKAITSDNNVILEFDNLKECDYSNTYFCIEMLEIVEEGYQKRMEEELKAKRVKKNIDVENDEVVQEMLSKVDVEKFKKILSGAFRMKASSLLGVDKLLKDWACAKRELYLALGRNLTIRKSVEYEMSKRDVEERKENLIYKFPRFL